MMKSEDSFHRDEEINDDESDDPSGRTEPLKWTDLKGPTVFIK